MRYWLAAVACFLVTAFLLSPMLGLGPPLAYRNTSPSVPLGWWLYSTKWPPERGDIVGMRHAPFWGNYVLLKRVQGVPGDRLCWIDDRLRTVPRARHWINDAPIPRLDPLAFEIERQYRDRGFTIWRGCRVLDEGEIAGFGDGPLAYGSWALGPVSINQLWGVYVQWRP
jgi:type IV secretory pathway protease TraF